MQSDKSSAEPKKQSGRWSREQHQRFMLGLMHHGKNWKKVEEIVATRSGSQVRSHAQKFFNKFRKNPNDLKYINQNPSINKSNDLRLEDFREEQVSLNDNNTDILKSHDEDNSLQTPLQIISLIKKQSADNGKVNLSSFKKSLQQNQEKQVKQKKAKKSYIAGKNSALNHAGNTKCQQKDPVLSTINEQEHELGFISSFKSMNNIISAYEALNQTDPNFYQEDQSFLIGLTKKYKKYFSKGGQFEGLIDFGNPHQIAKAAELEKSVRKKSWTLAQGIKGDNNDLQHIKNRLKQNKNQQSTHQMEHKKQASTQKLQQKQISGQGKKKNNLQSP